MLTASKVGAFTAAGDIDVDNHALKNVDIVSGTIKGVSSFETNMLKSRGGMHVEKDATIGGSLTVSGSVMGSGSYTDISDARFKRDVRDLFGSGAQALEAVRRLRGVRYYFKSANATQTETKAKAKRNNATAGAGTNSTSESTTSTSDWPFALTFEAGEQIGFIAQEVEAVMPELVRSTPTDTPMPPADAHAAKDGEEDAHVVKSVAYSRAVPLLVEAIKALDSRVSHLDGQSTAGTTSCRCEDEQRRVAALEQRVHQQSAELAAVKAASAAASAATEQRAQAQVAAALEKMERQWA